MNDLLLQMALNHFGFDENQKARIVAFLPKAAYLADLVKNNRTVINEAIDVVQMITTQVAKTEAQS